MPASCGFCRPSFFTWASNCTSYFFILASFQLLCPCILKTEQIFFYIHFKFLPSLPPYFQIGGWRCQPRPAVQEGPDDPTPNSGLSSFLFLDPEQWGPLLWQDWPPRSGDHVLRRRVCDGGWLPLPGSRLHHRPGRDQLPPRRGRAAALPPAAQGELLAHEFRSCIAQLTFRMRLVKTRFTKRPSNAEAKVWIREVKYLSYCFFCYISKCFCSEALSNTYWTQRLLGVAQH